MKVIELTKGQVAIVDDEDFIELAQYRWYYLTGKPGYQGYAARQLSRPDGKQRTVLMHRVLMGLPPGRLPEVDHKNGNHLDNRRQNLRLATHAQNTWNCVASRNNKLGVKGVHLKKGTGKYAAEITVNGKKTHLGYFETVEQAEKAHNRAAVSLHGEFVRLN